MLIESDNRMAMHRLIVFVLVLNSQYILIKCNTCITTQESLGDNKGLSCIFPFVVSGKTYNECTTDLDPEGKLWCATETDGSDKQVTNKWGYCPDDEACLKRYYIFFYTSYISV